jgi:hypothetical protein
MNRLTWHRPWFWLLAAAVSAQPRSGARAAEVLGSAEIRSVPITLSAPVSPLVSVMSAPLLGPTFSLAAPAVMPGLAAPAVLPPAPAPTEIVTALASAGLPSLAAPAAPDQKAETTKAGVLDSLQRFLNGLSLGRKRGQGRDSSQLGSLFDGAASGEQASTTSEDEQGAVKAVRRASYPHQRIPVAILPNGEAILPDSFSGGYHGTDITPEDVARQEGLPARGPVEDWRLSEHAEAKSAPVSAFRGATPFPTTPDGETGASYWAGDGGWVYEVRGVPSWEVNSDLEGRVRRSDGTYRGNLMSEVETSFPARTPLECIRRWGQVQEGANGKLLVKPGGWVANPRYDPDVCRKFWGTVPS